MFGFFNFRMFPANQNSINWNELKKTGKVTENKSVKDGIVTITKYYVSNDGMESFEETESYPKGYEDFTKLYELKSKLKEAEDNQEYEKCIELRDKINTLKKKK